MKKIILIPLLFFIAVSGVFANILMTESGVRTFGLGHTFTGIADDVNCVYYNPAGLGQLPKAEVYLNYNNYYSQDLVQSFNLNVAAPNIADGTFAFSYNQLGTGSAVKFMDDYSESLYQFSYGVEVLPLFYSGVNIKYFLIDYKYDASALGCDLGFLIRVLEKHVSIGLDLKNINEPKVWWQSQKTETMDSAIRFGAAYRPNNSIVIGADINNLEQVDRQYSIGGEIWLFNRLLAPRIGMLSSQSHNFYYAGFSICYKVLRIDYALEKHFELGYNHQFGILMKW